MEDSHTGRRFAAIHDHGDTERTVGLGEFTAVLNGVHFRTRHNDYQLVMPSTKTKNIFETEPIPFPPLPPKVASAKVRKRNTPSSAFLRIFLKLLSQFTKLPTHYVQ